AASSFTSSTTRTSWNARTSRDRKSTRLNSSHGSNSYAVFCLKKNTNLFNSSVSYSNRCVCQDASLRVLGDYPITVFQDKTNGCHSWLRLAWEVTVLEAL